MSISLSPVPADGSALLAAARWLEGLVQGPVATTVALLAIASTGLMMLTGRLPVRRGLAAVLGCFILFGAPAIARGIMGAAPAVANPEPLPLPAIVTFTAPTFTPPPPPPPPPVNHDPYAGASITR
ncbi:MAG: TrbC/VirB2 family protein [Pseudomonadota bacterium]|nr:TrbC/VirB2 family protein [Pseudomonadota bacterium]